MSRIGKKIRNVDREFHRVFEGVVIESVEVTDYDPETKEPRYQKALEVIEWEKPPQMKGTQEIRFMYLDRGIFQRRPLILSPRLLEKLLNLAIKKGVLEIKNTKIVCKAG